MTSGSDLDAKSLEVDWWDRDELHGFYIHQVAAGERRMMGQVESSKAGVSGRSSGSSKIHRGLVSVRTTIEDVLS